MNVLSQSDSVLCHAYDIQPLDLGLSAASWTDWMKEDFADTARLVECEFEEFHSPKAFVCCIDVTTGKVVSVKRDSLILVAKEFDIKRKMVLTDIDGVLTRFDKSLNATYLQDGTKSQYTNLVDSVHAEATYVFNILRAISKNADIGVLTARGDSQRIPTELFLNEHLDSIYSLFMRGFGCNKMSAESLKVRMIQSCILPYYDVECFIEDTVRNVQKVNRILPHIKTMIVKH